MRFANYYSMHNLRKENFMSVLVKCENLSKSYGKKLALDDISLELEAGHIVGLLGPNGSGKTTLIKLLNGLLSPDSGTILIKNKGIGAESKKCVSYLPDQSYLNMEDKVKTIIAFFKDFYEDFSEEKALSMLKTLNIDPEARMKTLSKGNKEKVQLVLVMSRKADLYILDEPIAGVDPAARDFILKLILDNYNPEGTILISTHLISDIENILDQVIFLKDGKVVRNDSVDNIRENEGKSLDALFREVFKCSEN